MWPGSSLAGNSVAFGFGLLHCAVFRRSEGSGGCFALYDGNGPLFAAVAESNLAFGLGQGFFGRMVSDARYGADIFENMDESDA